MVRVGRAAQLGHARLLNMRADTYTFRPCARNSGGKLRPSTGAGHDPFDDAEGLLAERMAGSDPRDAAVVCHELCCLSIAVFLVILLRLRWTLSD